MQTHTPGPWRIEVSGLRHEVINPIGAWVATAHCQAEAAGAVPRDESRASAALIAAAPELLEALQAVEWGGTYFYNYGDSNAKCCPNCLGVHPDEGSESDPLPKSATFGHKEDCKLSAALQKAGAQ